ncbi:hypothetical protein ACMAZF_09550 [Psychrobium sp. nBUS_13]|uniref:hypothetical protein n=1 Tax=Psychrobium sp. nBUS_13 TaxID=3395319 RepID=UPI003EBC6FDB
MKYIVPIILFLVSCTTQPTGKYFPDGLLSEHEDLDSFVQSWYGKHLASMDEPSLANATNHEYRFTWLPTFHQPMIFRISIEDEKYIFYVKRTDGAGGYDSGRIVDNQKIKIPIETARNIISKLESDCQFWGQPTTLDTMGFDGSQWIFEASKKGRYHVVDRWSPDDGCFYEIGVELMSLSNLKINEIY